MDISICMYIYGCTCIYIYIYTHIIYIYIYISIKTAMLGFHVNFVKARRLCHFRSPHGLVVLLASLKLTSRICLTHVNLHMLWRYRRYPIIDVCSCLSFSSFPFTLLVPAPLHDRVITTRQVSRSTLGELNLCRPLLTSKEGQPASR